MLDTFDGKRLFMFFRVASLWVLSAVALSSVTGAALNSAPSDHNQTVRGYLVDLVCTREEAGKLATFGHDHTKKCLQMPVCARSGYAVLFSSNEVLPFDEHGNELAGKLIASRHQEKGIVIKATGIRQENIFHVLRID
jgi:hypothetical protein